MKKICNLFFCFLILLIFASCKKDSTNQGYQGTRKPITFTFYTADRDSSPEGFNDEIASIITDRTGVNLQILGSQRDAAQDIQLMIANHKYPDLIFAKNELSKLIESNSVIPLDDYIKKYGNNVRKLYGNQLNRLRNTLIDPQIYTLGTYEIKKNLYVISGNVQLQNAVLREFGYPQVKTLDDLENILKAYKAKYPTIEGKKTIGLSIVCDSWYWLISLSNPGGFMLGYPDDGQWIIDQRSLSAKYKFLDPNMHIYYKWLNKIYHEGLLDPESFTQTYDMYKSKLATGTVLCTTFPHWGIEESQRRLVAADMVNRTFAYLPVTAGEEYKDPTMKDYGFSGGWGIAISSSCKDPVRAFQFLDYMCSEEAQILTNWGVPGKDYFYDKNGHRFSAKNPKSSGVGSWTYPFPEAGTGYLDSTGNPIGRANRDVTIAKYNAAEKETLKAYGVEMWTDLFPTPEELGISKHGQLWQYNISSSNQAILDDCDAYVKEELCKMILGPEDEFQSSWNNMQKTIKSMGIGKVEQELTLLIDIKQALWNY